MSNIAGHSSEERIQMAGWLRRLAKDMTDGDPVAAGKLVSAAKMIERQSNGPADRDAVLEEAADLCDQHLDHFSGTECTYRVDVAEAIRALKNAAPQSAGAERARNYFVIAYRWGCVNGHSYFLYCGPDKTKAEALARSEQADRGGKYGCAVYEFDPDGTDYKLVAYFGGSMNAEKAPFHNHRIDYFQTLGHKFDRFAEGFSTHVEDDPTLTDRDGKPARVVKEYPAQPPEWVVQERDRAKQMCDFMTDIDEKRRSATDRREG